MCIIKTEPFDFDFDYLVSIRDNPDKFNEEVNRILEAALQKYPEEKRQRMRAYLWRMNQELSKYKNPNVRFNKMVELFWKQFAEFKSALDNLKSSNPNIILSELPNPKDNIIEFKKNEF